MGAIITIKTKEGEINYEFDKATDGEEFKEDIEKELKNNKDKTKRKIIINKTEDKPKVKEKENQYDKEIW